MGEEDQVVARLLVDEGRVESAERQLGPEVKSEARPDGSVVFEVPVVNYDAFRSFVLGFLDHAELLEPPAGRADVIEWLTTLSAGDPEDLPNFLQQPAGLPQAETRSGPEGHPDVLPSGETRSGPEGRQ